MTKPLVSVVLSTYQRAHLLARSLHCYEHQEFDNKDFELIVIDDHSTDGTDTLVGEWSHRTGIKSLVIRPHPKYESWRDCGATLNIGIRASSGKHILLTHPEVMVGRKSIAACIHALENEGSLRYPLGRTPGLGIYACCRIYYLGPRDQVLLDGVDWKGKGPLAVRNIQGFYELDTNGHPDYSHRATDIVAQPGSRMPQWESWVFGGMSRETWKQLGGMLETQKWGAVDVAWHARRRTLGIPTHTCPEDETICVHQNHSLPGDTETPRDMDEWVKELRNVDLQTPSKLVYPFVNNLDWE